MVLLSEKQQRDLLIIAGLADFLVGGKLTAAARTAVVATLRRAVPAAAKGAARFVPAVARTAGMVAMRHPYVAAGAVIYVAVTEREKIRTLLEQGYDVIEERLPTPSLPPSPGIPGVEEIITSGMVPQFIPGPIPTPVRMRATRRKASTFNKAVSAGMKAIKKSTSYGGKGVIKPAKKAFSVVVKLAAAKKKKKKAPNSGIRRRIWNAMKGLR
jgi:hypothetical protein